MMDGSHGEIVDEVIERARVREVAGVFRSRQALDDAVDALLLSGYDRADIDLMGSIDAVRAKFGDVYVPAEELADLADTPRRAYVARDDTVSVLTGTAAVFGLIGALAGAYAVVASGGSLVMALAAGAGAGVVGVGFVVLMSRVLGRESARERETMSAAGGLVLWVRVRSPEHEAAAQNILQRYGADAVRVHEVPIEKRLEDIPLSRVLAHEPRD
jgi:hypothetical protein